eukprot:1111163-Rhodomonas_salina.1
MACGVRDAVRGVRVCSVGAAQAVARTPAQYRIPAQYRAHHAPYCLQVPRIAYRVRSQYSAWPSPSRVSTAHPFAHTVSVRHMWSQYKQRTRCTYERCLSTALNAVSARRIANMA